MTTDTYSFTHQLSRWALHIDYLRLRCGRETPFARHFKTSTTMRAHIAFSEWDVVLFIPCLELYPKNLIDIYSNKTLAGSIAGSAGFFNYLWNHPINKGWKRRILEPNKTISLLVSLRFTDAFRRNFGLGAELLFCSFLQQALHSKDVQGVSAVVAHSVGWNDATILLDATLGNEDRLLRALTKIRYCSEKDLGLDAKSNTYVIAATYSHLLGNLKTYTDKTLRFGAFNKMVKSAHLLVRVNPDVEPGLRKRLFKVIDREIPRENGPRGSELGHYNFSASIKSAFRLKDEKAVRIIQGFREKVGKYLETLKLGDEASFPETTTEITFKEPEVDRLASTARRSPRKLPGTSPKTTLSGQYRERLESFLAKEPQTLFDAHAAMTAHRFAILLGTIITYLDDPVRGSVVGHLCRFLDKTFGNVLRSDRAGQEDLCHILEYALHQATDGLTQFQHDANSLGLSGRGGYNRLLQAVEEFVEQVRRPFQMDFVPLITFGLRPANDGTTLKYWIDLPFSTAFVPERWYVAYHDVARMSWLRSFEWRLDSYRVWRQFSRDVTALESRLGDEHRQEFVLGRDVVEEFFPNFLLLNVVCAGKIEMLDRLMVAREFLTRPQPALIQSLTVRLALDVLLELQRDRHHESRGRKKRGGRLEEADFEKVRDAKQANHKHCEAIAFEWWNEWWEIKQRLGATGEKGKTAVREVVRKVEEGATRLREVMVGMKETFGGTKAAFESTINLLSTPAFKRDARQIVNRVISLLAIRGRDYSRRRQTSFADFDTSAVDFGFVLAKIDVMRRTAEQVSEKDISRYRQAIEDGEVFASGPRAPSLAHILTATGETIRPPHGPAKRHPTMLSCLSSILSLWHTAVTRSVDNDRESPPDLLGRLQDLEIVDRRPF